MFSDLYFNIKFFLDKRLKIRLIAVTIIHVINTFLDIISVASVPALMIFFFNKNQIQVELNLINDILDYFLNIFFGIPIIFIFLFIFIFFLLKTFLGIFYFYFFAKLGYDLEINLAKRIVKKKLQNSYLSYIQGTYSAFLNLTTFVINEFVQNNFVISFRILVNFITIFAFGIFLLLINPITTLTILILSTFIFVLYYLVTNEKFKFFGKHKLILYEKMLSKVKDTFYSFKEVKIYGKEDKFTEKFVFIKTAWAHNKLKFLILSNLPKLFLELALVLIIMLIFYISFKLNLKLELILVNITIFLISAQRLLPRIIEIMRNFSKINYSSKAQKILVKELKEETVQKQKRIKILFKNKIQLENIDYGYTSEKLILNNINLEIKKGTFVGIKGGSGEGKTTLINLLMGLLQPQNGKIFVDSRNINEVLNGYMNLIAYVPQRTYILNESIKNNLIFENNELDISDNDILKALDIVKLNNIIKSYPKGLDTVIGDTTFKASEGEIQRFGIARALLQKKEILILDEITSSLDQQNEKNIMNIISSLKRSSTIIMISHKNSSLEFCDKVYTLQNKNLSNS